MTIANKRGYVERGFLEPFDGHALYPLSENAYPKRPPLIPRRG